MLSVLTPFFQFGFDSPICVAFRAADSVLRQSAPQTRPACLVKA
jgi:hypothetical protein